MIKEKLEQKIKELLSKDKLFGSAKIKINYRNKKKKTNFNDTHLTTQKELLYLEN